MAVIEVVDLVKVYPGGVRALDGISFEVEGGESFGFLGPNGAGKTTAIRILVALLGPTEGTAMVDGIDVTADPEEVRKRIGYAAQFIAVDDDLTAAENLVLQGRLHGVPAAEARERTSDLLDVFSLSDVADRRAGTFSGGMRRRLDLAQALVHGPRIVFLDEPTTGLDPQNRKALWEYLRLLSGDGVTIFLTTQYMEEADTLAERLAIIDHGKLVVEGTPDRLKDALGGDTVTVTVADDASPELMARAAEEMRAVAVAEVTTAGPAISAVLADGGSDLAEVVRRLDDAGVPVARLELAEPRLDDVFLRYTGERLRVEEVKARSRTPLGRRRRP